MIGGCMVKHWSKTQSTIDLSSGEAELSGIGSGMAQTIGIQSLAADMGKTLHPRVHSNATAAIGISKRQGLGKIRHLHTADLWVQEKVRSKAITLLKVLGTENPADASTKYLGIHGECDQKDEVRVSQWQGKARTRNYGTQQSNMTAAISQQPIHCSDEI